MPLQFKAKTQEGYTIKILAELFQNNIKTACFVISDKGITLKMMDSHCRVLFYLDLLAENFSMYKFRHNGKRFLGINLNHFHKMLKSIKKKDSIVLFIEDDSPNDLGIRVLPKENNRVTTSYIKIQNIQNLDIDLPEGYDKPVIVPSNEFQKMCKDMNNIGNSIVINSKKFYIKFLCNAGSVYSREVIFGELEDEDEDDDDIRQSLEDEYTEEFDTEQLSRIIKISGLSSTMQIYPKENLPLCFRTNVGNLGKLSIYIKSKKQIENEELDMDNLEISE